MTASATPLPIVLVHGAWHDGRCWADVRAELDARGCSAIAVDLPGHGASDRPLGDLAADAAHVAEVVTSHDRPVVLVGHSYGGAVITEAAGHAPSDAIAQLVYVAAFALDSDESVMSFLRGAPRREVALSAAMVAGDDGTITLDADAAAPALYGSCTPEQISEALGHLGPQPAITLEGRVTGSPRDAIPSTYVVCARDAAVHPDHQRILAQRCGRIESLDTDHSPFLSAAPALADIIAGHAVRAADEVVRR